MQNSTIIQRNGQVAPLQNQTQYLEPVSAVGVSPSSYTVPMQTCMGQPDSYAKGVPGPVPYQVNHGEQIPPFQFINVNEQQAQQFQMQNPQLQPQPINLDNSNGSYLGQSTYNQFIPRLLIIGGGFAGLRLAVNMSKSKFNILLVDRKDFFEYSPSVPELYRRPEKFSKLIIKFEESIDRNNFVQAGLSYIERNQATIKCTSRQAAETQLATKGWQFNHLGDDSLVVRFDFCVVCIGSTYPAPFKTLSFNLAERQNEILRSANEIRDIRYTKVIIVGGGYVGVETACNVALVANKPVVIYNRGDQICKELPDQAKTEVLKKLQKFNVQILTNRELMPGEAEAERAYVINCTGASCQPNRQLYSQEFMIDQSGSLVTSDYLNLRTNTPDQECNNIFGAGDCIITNKNSVKLGYIAILQADYISDLLKKVVEKKVAEPKLAYLGLPKYADIVKEPNTLLISLGDEAVLSTGKGVQTGIQVKPMKTYIRDSTMAGLRNTFWGKSLMKINQYANKFFS